MSYQWSFNTTNILGATNATLFLPSAQFTNAGIYSVVISNVVDSVLSSNAVLTVNPPPPCDPAPAGLVSWWAAEGNAFDQISGNNGTLIGNASYGPGEVGQGFVLNGNGGPGCESVARPICNCKISRLKLGSSAPAPRRFPMAAVAMGSSLDMGRGRTFSGINSAGSLFFAAGELIFNWPCCHGYEFSSCGGDQERQHGRVLSGWSGVCGAGLTCHFHLYGRSAWHRVLAGQRGQQFFWNN